MLGIVAAVIAALYPNLWAPDGQLQAETLSMFAATVLVLLFAYRLLAAAERAPARARRRSRARLGALARSELILLVPLRRGSARVDRPATAACARSCDGWARRCWRRGRVIAPWTIYNSTRFVHPVLLSAQFDPLLASANCDSVYYGELQGYFDINCAHAIANKDRL